MGETALQAVQTGPHCDGDLFDPILPATWFDDESLFSLCSRQHRLSGNRLAANTCLQLFGHATQGVAHDFPSRLGVFAERTRVQLGSAAQIIRAHTILPYYLPFRSADIAQRAMAAMQGSTIDSLKFGLGLLTSRFRANHPLKACPACMRADRERWSTPYWHVAHQLPGVWVCPLHGEPLLVSSLKATGVGRFQWVLPDHSHLSEVVSTRLCSEPLTGLAKAAVDLWSLQNERHLAPEHAARVYRHALREMGLLRGDGRGRLRLQDIGRQYATYVAPLRQIEELCALPRSPDDAARDVARMAYEPRSGTHPLRHLVLIGWLLGDFALFIRRYDALVSEPLHELWTSGDDATAKDKPSPLRAKVLDLIRSGSSVSAASRQMGVDPATGMAWAASVGFQTTKRPSVIKGDLKQRMVAALEQGADKRPVAAMAGVSIESVTRLLRTEVGLNEAWRNARHTKAQDAARQKWRVVVANNPFSGVKAVRMLEPAAYAWLYRNDKDWLDEQISRLGRQRRRIGPRVNWDARDRDLAEAVQRAGIALATMQPGAKIKLWQIYQTIPELKAKLAKLDRLPLTRSVIRQTLSASTEPTAIDPGSN